MNGHNHSYDIPDELPAEEPDVLLTRREASAYLARMGLSIQPQTLAAFVSRGMGPAATSIGPRVFYAKRALHSWGVKKLTGYRASARPPQRSPG